MIQQTDLIDNQQDKKTGFYLYCPPNMPLSRDLFWSGAYITSSIYYGTMVRPDYRQGVPINMARLKETLGRKAQRAMLQMRKNGIIARVGGYVVGECPYHYRLIPPYDQCQRIECTDRKLIGKIVGKSRRRLPVVKWLEKHARRLQIDKASALAEIPHLRPKRVSGDIQALRTCAERCVRLIASGDAVVALDKTQGRVFAPHVTLNSTLRKHLRSPDGARIVSLDIRNCQPLLLTLAFAQYFHHDRRQRYRLLHHTIKPKKTPYVASSLSAIGRRLQASVVQESLRHKSCEACDLHQSVHHIERACVSSRVSPVPPPSPVVDGLLGKSCCWGVLPSSCRDWCWLASSGELYEHFGQDRPSVKEQFILVLFGKRPLSFFEVGQRIISKFPDVAEVITAMKTKNGLVGTDSRPYRYVACMLQLYESTIMIASVCGRIMRERPDTPVWTIHDCVMTTEPHKQYVESVIREEFAAVGISPSIKEELM